MAANVKQTGHWGYAMSISPSVAVLQTTAHFCFDRHALDSWFLLSCIDLDLSSLSRAKRLGLPRLFSLSPYGSTKESMQNQQLDGALLSHFVKWHPSHG